jgi:hypothetical protein
VEGQVDAMLRIERTQSARFPFRIAVERGGRTLLAVRAQADWPPPGAQVFCLREREPDPDEKLEPVETVRIAALERIGPRLVLTLDRAARRRCEFLVVRKLRKGGDGAYEQVFFRTDSALRAHRRPGRVELVASAGLELAIDARERYPWRFPGAGVERRPLPAGDYALLRDGEPIAVAERKTLADVIADLGAPGRLHERLAALEAQPRPALVIEAQYADFLDPERTRPWPAAHAARMLAELAALHPKLPVVYAGSRKLANHWAARWFAAVAAEAEAGALPLAASPAPPARARSAPRRSRTRSASA